MSEHLPECPTTTDPHGLDDGYACPCECQCEILRACEERLREGWCVITCGNTHYTIGYEEGLDAAREAVAGVGVRKDTSYDMRVQALAAIDALRGSGNPNTPPSAEKGEKP